MPPLRSKYVAAFRASAAGAQSGKFHGTYPHVPGISGSLA